MGWGATAWHDCSFRSWTSSVGSIRSDWTEQGLARLSLTPELGSFCLRADRGASPCDQSNPAIAMLNCQGAPTSAVRADGGADRSAGGRTTIREPADFIIVAMTIRLSKTAERRGTGRAVHRRHS